MDSIAGRIPGGRQSLGAAEKLPNYQIHGCDGPNSLSSFGWDYSKAANKYLFMTNNMRTAIVTGGGSGIGQAVGLELCAAGWTVVIAGRKAETLERTRQLSQGSGLIETHVVDVTDDASVEQLFDAVIEIVDRNGAILDSPNRAI